MASYEHGYEDERFVDVVSQNFHCSICLNVFKEPVMCQRNQHCFCRPCISRHLEKSKTCPTCNEELSLETISKAPRIVIGCLAELKISCDYFARGCEEILQLGDLQTHVKECGFAPVMCSNEGCLAEVNQKDKSHHENTLCKFRKLVECRDCTELRKDIDEIKVNMTALKYHFNELHDIKTNLVVIKRDVDEVKELRNQFEQLATMGEQMQCMHTETLREIQRTNSDRKNETQSIVIAGGRQTSYTELRSVEIFDWFGMSWSQLRQMKECRVGASSYVFSNQITITGGNTNNGATKSITAMNSCPFMERAEWYYHPYELPSRLYGHSSVMCKGQLVIIGGYDAEKSCCSNNIHSVGYPPTCCRLLSRMSQRRCFHGVQVLHDKILILGGSKTSDCTDHLDSVILYDINRNHCKQMAPLPFAVSEMATVSWGDNVIVIGGASVQEKALNTVVIYNVKTEKSHMLPQMKCKRRGCSAVVVRDTIVVMGGRDERRNCLRSVECFSFSRYSWEDLPPMNEARARATAVAL